MKIELRCVGKTESGYLSEGIEIFRKRLVHYSPFDLIILPDIKNAPVEKSALLKKEGVLILEKLTDADFLVLLDENGKQYSSVELSVFIENKMVTNTPKLIFQIGGAFGFSDAVYARANAQISLSALTFSHQMVRLIIIEQLYRAFTILKGEKYHNV